CKVNYKNKFIHYKKGGLVKVKNKCIIFVFLFFCSTLGIKLAAYNKELFTHIYNTHAWPGKESLSGPGSTLKETAIIRKKISELLQDLNVKIFLDAPCGDFHWMRHTDLSFIEQYIGMDIVDPLIRKNKQRYEDENRQFVCANIVTDPLPQADIMLCRDCLVHLRFEDIQQALKNMKDSGITYLLVTTYPRTQINQKLNITAPRPWRPLNLQKPPFNFPEPLVLINEGCKHDKKYPDKSLGLWKLEDISTI
ncbi:MAG: class I SAM-dependent methyltransferase, partial [Candidatus Babeliales bacterium]